MKKFSKFIAVSLASSMMLSTVALAAEDDFYNKSDLKTPKYGLDQVSLNEEGSQDKISLNYTDYFREVDKYLYTIEQTKEAYAKANKAGEPLNWKAYLKKEEGIPLEGEEVVDEFGEIESIVGVKKEYNLNDGIEFTLKSKEGKEIVINQENREESLKKLKKEGYTFKYRANDKVFKNPTADKETTSEDGILFQSDLGATSKTFVYEIDVYKNGEKVTQSARVTGSKLMDYSQRVEEITSVEVIDQNKNSLGLKTPEAEENTLKVMGKVRGITEEKDITKFIKEAKAEKPLVLELVLKSESTESGVVLAVEGLAKGTTKINLETENNKKGTFSITVGEKVKIKEIELKDGNVIKLPENSNKEIKLEIKDNYGRLVAQNTALGITLQNDQDLYKIKSTIKDYVDIHGQMTIDEEGIATMILSGDSLPSNKDMVEDKEAKLVIDGYEVPVELSVIKVTEIESYDLKIEDTVDKIFDLKYTPTGVGDSQNKASKRLVFLGKDPNGVDIDFELAENLKKNPGDPNPLELTTNNDDNNIKNFISLDPASKDKATIEVRNNIATIKLTDKAKAGDKIKVEVRQENGSLNDVVGSEELEVVDTSAKLEGQGIVFKDPIIDRLEKEIKFEDLFEIKTNKEVELDYEIVSSPDSKYPALKVFEKVGAGYKNILLGELRFNENEDVNKLIESAKWSESNKTLTVKIKAEDEAVKGKVELAFIDKDNTELKSKDLVVDIADPITVLREDLGEKLDNITKPFQDKVSGLTEAPEMREKITALKTKIEAATNEDEIVAKPEYTELDQLLNETFTEEFDLGIEELEAEINIIRTDINTLDSMADKDAIEQNINELELKLSEKNMELVELKTKVDRAKELVEELEGLVIPEEELSEEELNELKEELRSTLAGVEANFQEKVTENGEVVSEAPEMHEKISDLIDDEVMNAENYEEIMESGKIDEIEDYLEIFTLDMDLGIEEINSEINTIRTDINTLDSIADKDAIESTIEELRTKVGEKGTELENLKIKLEEAKRLIAEIQAMIE